jgi:hypothetical protein
MRAMRAQLLTACVVVAGLALSACGNDDDNTNKACIKGSDNALESAARSHVDVIIVGVKKVGQADDVDVKTCKTGDNDATAVVTVKGINDKTVEDQRHTMKLAKKNGKWVIVQDNDTLRCRKGHGHRNFSTLQCNSGK